MRWTGSKSWNIFGKATLSLELMLSLLREFKCDDQFSCIGYRGKWRRTINTIDTRNTSTTVWSSTRRRRNAGIENDSAVQIHVFSSKTYHAWTEIYVDTQSSLDKTKCMDLIESYTLKLAHCQWRLTYLWTVWCACVWQFLLYYW